MLTRLLSAVSLSKKGFFRVLGGCAIMAFTLVNIHIPAKITEGGILGLSLFSHQVLGLNPAIVSPVLDMLCILIGVSLLGKNFRRRTALASVSFAVFYKIAQAIGPVLPSLYNLPVVAAILGGSASVSAAAWWSPRVVLPAATMLALIINKNQTESCARICLPTLPSFAITDVHPRAAPVFLVLNDGRIVLSDRPV